MKIKRCKMTYLQIPSTSNILAQTQYGGRATSLVTFDGVSTMTCVSFPTKKQNNNFCNYSFQQKIYKWSRICGIASDG